MSMNNAHVEDGVLLHAGESILLFCDRVDMSLSVSSQSAASAVTHGLKSGRLYLTTHRMLFHNKSKTDRLRSFSAPFVQMSDMELQQPIFGANYIKGTVTAQENGNFDGAAKIKLYFKNGGAIDFGQAMMRTAQIASRASNATYRPSAAYARTEASSAWYQAPPPAYSMDESAQLRTVSTLGWSPSVFVVFPQRPEGNSVFMTDDPPPYPGIGQPNFNNGETPASAPTQSRPIQGWYDPNAVASGSTTTAYVNFPPPSSSSSSDRPPSYDESVKKNA